MEVFDSSDYREIIKRKIASLPKEGYGQLSKLASHLKISKTLVSQILNGTKAFSEDQGCAVAEFLGFSEHESIYLLLLIQQERAGSQRLKNLLRKQIQATKKSAEKLGARLPAEGKLSDEQQAVFYSEWHYTAIHTLTSIERFQTEEAILKAIGLPRERTLEAISWLVENGICKREGDKILIGPATTFIDRDSHWASRHHLNWRHKGMAKLARKSDRDFFFTAPISISRKDHLEFRKELFQLVEKLSRRVQKTEPEQMSVISIDYFEE